MTDQYDSIIANRKLEHLQAFDHDPEIERQGSGFDRLRLTHRALPELDFDDIDTRCQFLGKTLSFPLIISSMTGGTGSEVLAINRNLAQAANTTGVAMAVGSQRVMFASQSARDSFALRELAPDVPLVGNLGAVQLNYGVGLEGCQDAIDVLQADALYLHLNPLQEAVQPEGDRNFAGLASAIAELSASLPVPVLLKEVGAGLSSRDIELGLGAGVRYFDVAGRGGSSWSRIEYHRRARENDDLGLVFQDWGISTVDAIQDARPVLDECQESTTLIASGGVRNGIDMAKALILGADLCGMAAPLLSAAQESCDAVVECIEKIRREYHTALFLLGCSSTGALKRKQTYLR